MNRLRSMGDSVWLIMCNNLLKLSERFKRYFILEFLISQLMLTLQMYKEKLNIT